MNDLNKIAKWAREEIETLRQKVATRDQKIAELTAEFDINAPVTWDDFTVKGVLPPRSNVRFNTPDGWIEVGMRNGAVLVRGMTRLYITPDAANVFKVTTERD